MTLCHLIHSSVTCQYHDEIYERAQHDQTSTR